jgi:hypothetical protein
MDNKKELIQIKDGAEYPIICDGKNHYYYEDLRSNKPMSKPFEKCSGKHPEI